MSDTTTKQIEIVLKGRDDGSLNLLGQAERRVTSLAQALRQGGDIGELSGVKKFGKNLGEFLGTSQGGTISANAGQLRNQAATDYAATLKGILETERQAEAVDKARVGAMLERSNAANRLKRELAAINLEEKRQLSRGATGLLKGEYGPAEIRDEANVSRAAAEKAYQEVLARSVDVQMRAAKSDEDRRKALLAKAEAARQYAKTLDQINTAEANAIKANGGGLTRGIAIAGGVLLAVNAAGRLADAWDKANQKIKEGKIRSSEVVGELAKALPVIGGAVQQAENLMMVLAPQGSWLSPREWLFGKSIVSSLRDANEEAARLDKLIDAQAASRRNAGSLANQFASLNATGVGRIFFDSDERLGAIRAERKRAIAIGTINQVSAALAKAEAEAIKKRESDLATIETQAREDRAKKVSETMRIFEKSRSASMGLIGDLMQGPDGDVRRLRDRTRNTVEELKRQIEEVTRNEPNRDIRDQRINALKGAIDTEQTTATLTERSMTSRARASAQEQMDQLKKQQEEDLRERQMRSLESQRAARTSLFDARGQTGYFNQSRQVEDFTRKTADNTAKANDKLDKLITTMEQFIAAGGQLTSL